MDPATHYKTCYFDIKREGLAHCNHFSHATKVTKKKKVKSTVGIHKCVVMFLKMFSFNFWENVYVESKYYTVNQKVITTLLIDDYECAVVAKNTFFLSSFSICITQF